MSDHTMQHGGDLGEAAARHGAGDPPWLDLSTGINPHCWPIPPALREIGWTRLPGRTESDALIQAARQVYGVPNISAVVAAPGTQALIQWLPRLAPGGGVAILSPTYAEHAQSWRDAGRVVAPIRALAEWPAEAPHRVVVNPNNPDGRILPRDVLLAAAETCAARGGWLILDESFCDVDPAQSLAPDVADLPVVILRSFGKFYGLAGLRLGFAIARPDIAALIGQALGPWAVSGPALAIGTGALRDHVWADHTRARLAREAAALDDVLTPAGLDVIGGTSLYRLARHPNARRIHAALARAHIWVRRFDWADDLLRFGLPPDTAALQRLREALRNHLQGA